jgi:hypothetical protein
MLSGEIRMTIDVPTYDYREVSDDDTKNVPVPTYKPKAIFQWPPECLWPFSEYRPDNDA